MWVLTVSGVFGRWFSPFCSPGIDGRDDLFEFVALFGEVVFDADGDLGVDGAGDDARGLELAEAFGEEAVGEAGDAAEDLTEADGAREHRADDGSGPSAANELDGGLEGGAIG